MENRSDPVHPTDIKCVVFDFGKTLSSDLYFTVIPPMVPQWRDVIQRQVFDEPDIIEAWLAGKLTIEDIAGILSWYIDMDIASIVATMEKGCEHLHFNEAVWNFAQAQKSAGRKTALVTANMDVFTKVVVPCHGLHEVFDVILNTFDYRELRKECLWPLAFQKLENEVHYGNSLLIEDGITEPAKFRKLGGYAYQYSTDKLFTEWLYSIGWQ